MVESLLGVLFILGFPLWLVAEEIVRGLLADHPQPQPAHRRVTQEPTQAGRA